MKWGSNKQEESRGNTNFLSQNTFFENRPTNHFKNFAPQNPEIVVLKLRKIRRSSDIEALKLWKRRSGSALYSFRAENWVVFLAKFVVFNFRLINLEINYPSFLKDSFEILLQREKEPPLSYTHHTHCLCTISSIIIAGNKIALSGLIFISAEKRLPNAN